MKFDLKGLKIAIIGGGDPCAEILDILVGEKLKPLAVQVCVVADSFADAPGMALASRLGVPTSTSYDSVCAVEDLDLVLKLRNDESLSCILEKVNKGGISILSLDSFQAMSFLSFLKTEEERLDIQARIQNGKMKTEEIVQLFDQFSSTVLNIAENKMDRFKAERGSLLAMEKELSQVIEGSTIPTFIINEAHMITHWNRACEKMTGYGASELVGTDQQWVPFRSAKRPTLADVVVGDLSQGEIEKYYGKAWRKSPIIQGGYEAEEFFPHLGDRGRWIQFTAAPIRSSDGKIIGAVETLRDRTEDKEARQAMALQDQELAALHEKYKKSEEKYRSLFNNNPSPIFIIDQKDLEILDVNHRVVGDYGYSKSELIGASFLHSVDASNGEEITRELGELGPGETRLFTKRRHHKKSGEVFFVNIKVVNAIYNHRDVFIASTTDISESVEKEAQLIQAGKLATLGTMAAGMAHEINQPLNVIQICSDLILKMLKKGVPISDEELSGMANDIIDNVARAAGVIKHVRDFARQSDRDLKKLNINEPIQDVFKVLGHQLSVHSVTVDLSLDENLPDILGEHNRLEQVFINLVTNAIDTMDEKAASSIESVEKKMEISTHVEDDHVVASVRDTGMGMSDVVKQKIFEPFFTTKETGKGTGLGTSISFGIIKEHKASIEIDTQEGEGSCFTIKFPIAQ